MADNYSIDEISRELARRSRLALEQRRARGEVMTYVEEDWVYREYPGMRVVRLCRLEDFKAADYPEYDDSGKAIEPPQLQDENP